MLAGGDAAMGIYYRSQPAPINEKMRHNAYPGVYALSKVIEEVLGEQFFVQYGVPYVCLRASWILHGDMILRHMSARNWVKRMTAAQQRKMRDGEERVAVLVHPDGRPLVRHVVGLEDVVQAFLLAMRKPAGKVAGETFHVAGPRAFDYAEAGEYLAKKIGAETVRVVVAEAHDFRIDIGKARRVLGYRPVWGIREIIDAAVAGR
jgi:UDP-glucose 4-epimerase